MLKAACKITSLIGLGALLCWSAASAAEASPTLRLGDRVRVTYVSDGEYGTDDMVGTLVDVSDSTIIVERSTPAWASGRHGPADRTQTIDIPRQAVVGLETSVVRGERWTGAVIGLWIGAAAGYLMGFNEPMETRRWANWNAADAHALRGAVLLAPVGALVGLAIAPGQRWDSSSAERIQLRYEVAGQRPRRIGLSVRF